MKRIQTYDYNTRILSGIQVLLLMVSVLLLVTLLFAAAKEQVGLFELMEKSLTYNILYLLSMFDAICFLELLYFRKQLKAKESFEGVILSMLILCITQLFLLNLIVTVALLIFLYKAMKANGFTIKSLYKRARVKKMMALPLFNSIFFSLSVMMIYTMINYQFI